METFSNVFQCGAREMLPSNQIHPMAGHWRDSYFHNNNPIVLELGCGRGEYTVGLAKRYPEKNFIGIDIKGARMWAGAKEAELSGLKNVAFLRTNIEIISSFFAKDLTSTYFMQRYQQIVRPEGLIHLKTDSPFLYTYTCEMLRLNDYNVLCNTADLYADDADNLADAKALKTHYEKQWLDRGLSIKYLQWQLSPKSQWEEPTIEIEHDSYRSYGRNYVASNPS